MPPEPNDLAPAVKRPEPPAQGWRGWATDAAQMLRFYSRLPLPRLSFEADPHAPPDFTRAPRMLPVAGAVIGAPGALALLVLLAAGLPPLVSAALAVAAAVLACGAFHEDGLADSFDGLGGGWTRERRLDIMKDSRVGSYGAAALALALIARVGCVAALAERAGALPAALAMIAAASTSRATGLLPLALLPPARADGVSALVGRTRPAVLAFALALGAAIAFALCAGAGLRWSGPAAGMLLGLGFAWLMTDWARRAIGGQTGDIAGACQQLAEIAFYVGLLMYIPHEDGVALHQRLPARP